MPQTCVKPDVKSHKSFVSGAFRGLAEPIERSEKIEDIIKRAAKAVNKAAGLSLIYSRAYEIWYGRAKITIEEKEAIAAAAQWKREKEARNELSELKTRIARLEARLVQTDEDFHSPQIAAFGHAMRGRG